MPAWAGFGSKLSAQTKLVAQVFSSSSSSKVVVVVEVEVVVEVVVVAGVAVVLGRGGGVVCCQEEEEVLLAQGVFYCRTLHLAQGMFRRAFLLRRV